MTVPAPSGQFFLSKEYFPMLKPNLAISNLISHGLKFSAPAQWIQVYAADLYLYEVSKSVAAVQRVLKVDGYGSSW